MKNFMHFIIVALISTIGYSQVTDNFRTAMTGYNINPKNGYAVIETTETSIHTQQIAALSIPT